MGALETIIKHKRKRAAANDKVVAKMEKQQAAKDFAEELARRSAEYKAKKDAERQAQAQKKADEERKASIVRNSAPRDRKNYGPCQHRSQRDSIDRRCGGRCSDAKRGH